MTGHTMRDRSRSSASRLLRIVAATLIAAVVVPSSARGYALRVKELATLEGFRGNAIQGYGLVVGLNGTGDRRQTQFTTQSLRNLLERQGISLPAGQMKVANVAGVVVTATLSPFARPGTMLDVDVASIGDAKSLRGGLLLMTPLSGADGNVYAVAQGPLAIGGSSAQSASGGASVQVNQTTIGRIPSGAIVERPAPGQMANGQPLSYVLKRPDFTTVRRLVRAIDGAIGKGAAHAVDARRVMVAARPNIDPVSLAATISELEVEVDNERRVVVSERTGTIVAGLDIPLAPVSIVHGGLTIQVHTDYDVSQPGPLSDGETVVVPQESVRLQAARPDSLELTAGATVRDLVGGLVALGANTSDIISVLQLLRESGALGAEVVVL